MSSLLIIIYNINQKGDQNITNSEEIDDPNVGTLISYICECHIIRIVVHEETIYNVPEWNDIHAK